jgi:glycosyltransferase involved in cell wall biosynthesis
VLVIDGDSRDSTAEIARQCAEPGHQLVLLRNPEKTTPAAFNLGIAHASGRYICIIGAHSRLHPGFFAAALQQLEQGQADVVGGPVETAPSGRGLLPWLLAQVVSHPFGVGNSRFRVSTGRAYVDAVPFAIFKREVFEVVGLFDTTLIRNQDTEFFGRLPRAGFRVLMDHAVRSTYYPRGTLWGLLVQGFRNAYWNVLVWRKNPRAFRLRHLVPGVAVCAGILGLLLGALWPPAVEVLAVLVALYAMSSVVAAAQVAWRRRRPEGLLLPPLFFVYHAVYGAGTLVGLRWLLPCHGKHQGNTLTGPLAARH